MSPLEFSRPWPPLAVAMLAALFAAGCGQGSAQTGGPGGPGGPGGQPGAVEVGVVTLVAQQLALRTELAGRTVAAQTAEIRPQVSGIVRQRLFTEGALVKAGQPLYQIDDALYQAALAGAQAALGRAEAALAAAQLKARRQDELLAADAGSRQDAEDAQAVLLAAQADVKTAQAALVAARINLGHTRIDAPIGGRVEASTVTAGALVTASQATALTTVQQLDPMLVDLPQSSVAVLQLRRQLASGALKRGSLAIRLMLEDGSAYPHPGQLRVSGVTVNAGTGAVTLRARVPNPDGLLLPGMYVRAVLDQAQDPAAILVPQAGISRNAGGEASALVVKADGKVEKRAVTVAEAVEGQWRVTAGLRAGDRLIIEGTGKVRDGQLVHALPAAAEVTPAAGAVPASASTASR